MEHPGGTVVIFRDCAFNRLRSSPVLVSLANLPSQWVISHTSYLLCSLGALGEFSILGQDVWAPAVTPNFHHKEDNVIQDGNTHTSQTL